MSIKTIGSFYIDYLFSFCVHEYYTKNCYIKVDVSPRPHSLSSFSSPGVLIVRLDHVMNIM